MLWIPQLTIFALARGPVSVHVDGHGILREPAGPPPANSHGSELNLLASDIAKKPQRAHSRADPKGPSKQPSQNQPPTKGPKGSGKQPSQNQNPTKGPKGSGEQPSKNQPPTKGPKGSGKKRSQN